MYTLSYFTERYRSYNTVELVEIINSPSHYQPIALQAARQELENRKISPEELREANKVITIRKEYKSDSRKKVDKLNKEITSKAANALDHFSPVQNAIPLLSKLKMMIVIVYSILLIYEAYLFFKPFSLEDLNSSDSSFYFIINAIPIVLLLLALCFFWPGKALGWTLLTIYIGHNLFAVFASAYSVFTSEGGHFFSYTAPSPMQIFVIGFFYVATLLTLNRDDIKGLFKVHHKINGPLVVGFLLFLLIYAINFGFV